MIGCCLAAALAVLATSSHYRLVEQYGRGDRTALDALARLDEKDVRAEVVSIRKLARKRRSAPEEAWLAAYPFTDAVSAHTELYVQARENEDQEAADRHAVTALGLLEAARERVPRLGPLWFLYLGLWHLERLEAALAERFAEMGTEAHPEEARLWLAAGAIAQANARFAPEQERDRRPSATRAEHLRRRMSAAADRRALLESAERHLARALQLDPSLHEAALRLAQLHQVRGDADRAAAALAAVPRDLEPALRYVTALVAGRTEEMRQHLDEAIASYRRAAHLLPGAETAWLALAHALDLAGSAAESQAALERVLRSDDAASADPHRMFPIFCAGGAEAVWAELRDTRP